MGYDETNRTFKFVNSWGQGWAQGGYAYLTYDFVQTQSLEAWALVDMDTMPPALPAEAQELNGVHNSVLQNEISAPVFVWQMSESSATFNIYWGQNPQGTSNTTATRPLFRPTPLTETGTYYLRVQAKDSAGNTSAWKTLFECRYTHDDLSDNVGLGDTHPAIDGETPAAAHGPEGGNRTR